MNSEHLFTKSLLQSKHGEKITRILAAAIAAVDPTNAVQKYLSRENRCLKIKNRYYDLKEIDRIFLIGFGKASVPMAESAVGILGDSLTSGIIITKSCQTSHLPISVFQGSHPIPDERSIKGTQRIVDLLSTTTENDLVIFLISGGGSALLTLPPEEISLAKLQTLTQTLLACGATINEINTLRKHLSQVKGGQLARLASPAQGVTLILSDVIGDPLDVIASGPTVPDATSFADALNVLEKYGISNDTPSEITDYLNRGKAGEIPETPKTDDPIFESVQNIIIGNNFLAAESAVNQAKIEGFNALLLTTSLQGEARIVGQILGAIARQISSSGDPIPRPACIVAGGETTVTIRGNGYGGRNQEVALGAVREMIGLENIYLITLATDGEDGPTDAAGAVVTGQTSARAKALGLTQEEFLSKNDSYHFFEPLGDLIKPGSTQTNVCDLALIFAL